MFVVCDKLFVKKWKRVVRGVRLGGLVIDLQFLLVSLFFGIILFSVYALIIGTLAWMQASLIYNPTAAIELNDPHWSWHDVAGNDGFKAYLRQGDPEKPIVVGNRPRLRKS